MKQAHSIATKFTGGEFGVHSRRRSFVNGSALFNERAHHTRLLTLIHTLTHELPSRRLAHRWDQNGTHGRAPRRELVKNAQIEIPVQRQAQRPGNGSGRHVQHVRAPVGFSTQCITLPHPKTMLLIHHSGAQIGEVHPRLNQGVGSHHELQFSRRQTPRNRPAFTGGHGTLERAHVEAQGAQCLAQPQRMLIHQHLGGSHQRRLATGLHGTKQSIDRHKRLA
ncbi:MAG: hypothetical protein BWY79_01915 [Actinobacteria bacterium ADurb.Bin444]|nr:MAG: hypothetical protein BWY79_01915 [Actinobacteria bacterium ADurb.Bin444]